MQYLAVMIKASLRYVATIIMTAAALWPASPCTLAQESPIHSSPLQWHACPPLPDPLGVAGPIVGVHKNILIAGGGANFALPVWESSKRWHDKLYALDLERSPLRWCELAPMPAPWGYSACVSTPQGIVVIGGNNAQQTLQHCWLIRLERSRDDSTQTISAHFTRLPDLPKPLANAQVAYINDLLLVCTGQTGNELTTATAEQWQLAWPFQQADVSETDLNRATWHWRSKGDHPGGPRSFAQLARLIRSDKQRRDNSDATDEPHNKEKHNHEALIVIGGRRQVDSRVEFLSDTWIFETDEDQWHRASDSPVAMTAGAAGAIGVNQIAVISGDDGRLFSQTDQLRDNHPGFARRAWIYDAGGDRWSDSFTTPANQVTSTAVSVGFDLWLISGEIRPRVRTPNVWKISVVQQR